MNDGHTQPNQCSAGSFFYNPMVLYTTGLEFPRNGWMIQANKHSEKLTDHLTVFCTPWFLAYCFPGKKKKKQCITYVPILKSIEFPQEAGN